VDHVGGVFLFLIEDENHLQPSPSAASTNHPPLALFPQLRLWPAGVFHHPLRLFQCNAMLSYVLYVPIVPAEEHGDPLNVFYYIGKYLARQKQR
jgi:hypothetical protein